MRQLISMGLMATDDLDRTFKRQQLIDHRRQPDPTIRMRQQSFVTPHPPAVATTEQTHLQTWVHDIQRSC